MPITVRTAPVTICRTFMRGVAPSSPPLLRRSTSFCTRAAGTAAATIASPGLPALFSMTATHRLVGAMLLNAVLRRSTCNFLKTSGSAAAPWVPMVEPYRTLIATIQPDLLKMGLIKVHENEHAITFADGANKVDFTVTDRHYHPDLTVYFITSDGEHFSIASLRDKLNRAQTKKREFLAMQATNEKYGLWDCNTPQAIREEGYRIAVLLNLKQIVTFLENHKQTLSELRSDDEFD